MRVNYHSQRYAAAANDMQTLITIEDTAFRRGGLGIIEYKQGRYLEAEQQLEKAMEMETDDAEDYFYLALTREKLGKTKGVEDVLRKAKELAEQEEDAELQEEIAGKLQSLNPQ